MSQVQTEFLEDRQAKLTVTVAPDRVDREMQAAARRIAKKLNIPGFRKGKAPYHIIVRYVGEGAILEEALDPLGQAVYGEALDEAGIDPYTSGALTDMTREPFTMTFTIPLQPEIDLGNYRDVRVPYEETPVTEEDVEKTVSNIREEQATLEPVERPVQMGDVAVLDIHGNVKAGRKKKEEAEDEPAEEKAPLIDRHDVRVLITEDATYPVPGFPEKIVGMTAGDQRTFEVKMPKDEEYDEEVRGKTIHFEVVCKEVYKRDLPELDDEFAKSVGEFESLDDLRAKVREQLEEMTRQRADNEYLESIFEQLEPSATVNYPPVMIEERIDQLVEDFDRRLRDRGLNVDEYLRLNDVTREQLREDFREEARRSLKRALMLTGLVNAETLTVAEEEIEDEIKTMLLSFGAQAAVAQQLFRSGEVRRTIANRLLSEKATRRLIDIARGQAPELTGEAAETEIAETTDEEKPAKKTRARKPKQDGEATAEAKPRARKKKSEAQTEESAEGEAVPSTESGDTE